MLENNIVLVILVMFVITFATRALPFYLLQAYKNNGFIHYLSRMMPPCVVLTLVIYSFSDLNFLQFPYGLPEVAAAFMVIIIHLRFKNVLLSIAGGILVFFLLSRFLM